MGGFLTGIGFSCAEAIIPEQSNTNKSVLFHLYVYVFCVHCYLYG